MGEWLLRKPEPANVRGLCTMCGNNLQKKETRKNKKKFVNELTYKSICTGCNKRRWKKKVWF